MLETHVSRDRACDPSVTLLAANPEANETARHAAWRALSREALETAAPAGLALRIAPWLQRFADDDLPSPQQLNDFAALVERARRDAALLKAARARYDAWARCSEQAPGSQNELAALRNCLIDFDAGLLDEARFTCRFEHLTAQLEDALSPREASGWPVAARLCREAHERVSWDELGAATAHKLQGDFACLNELVSARRLAGSTCEALLPELGEHLERLEAAACGACNAERSEVRGERRLAALHGRHDPAGWAPALRQHAADHFEQLEGLQAGLATGTCDQATFQQACITAERQLSALTSWNWLLLVP